jgi:hypothetical protein
MTWTWQRGPSARRLRRRLGAGARSRWLHGAVARRVGCGPLRHELISPRSRSAWIAAPGSGDPRPWLVALPAGYRIHLAVGSRSDCPMPCQVYDGIGWLQDVPGPCTTRRSAVGAVDRQRCPSPSQRRTRTLSRPAPEDRALVILEVCDYRERGHDERQSLRAPHEHRRSSASRPARVAGLLVAITWPFL